jgi:hypothetical protein
MDITMRIIRLILGRLIPFFNWAFPPKGIKRDPNLQVLNCTFD